MTTPDATQQGFQPKLTSIQQNPLTFDPADVAFTTLVGLDAFGNIWTSLGVVRNNGYFLTPWTLQPRPTIHQEETKTPLPPPPTPQPGAR
jgi:hypothetical protein